MSTDNRLLVLITADDAPSREWCEQTLAIFNKEQLVLRADSEADLADETFVEAAIERLQRLPLKDYKDVTLMAYGAAGFAAALIASAIGGIGLLLLNTPDLPQEFQTPRGKATMTRFAEKPVSSLMELNIDLEQLVWMRSEQGTRNLESTTKRTGSGPVIFSPKHLGEDPLADPLTNQVFAYLFWAHRNESFNWDVLCRYLRERRQSHYYGDQVYDALISKGKAGLANKLAHMRQAPGGNYYVSQAALDRLGKYKRANAGKKFGRSEKLSGEGRFVKSSRPDVLSDFMIGVPGAICIPIAESGRRDTGVLYHDGSYCEVSEAWYTPTSRSQAPKLTESTRVDFVEGRHLYAGHVRSHFGHFILETLARFWAIDSLDEPVSSIVMHNYERWEATDLTLARKFLDLLGIDLPITLVTEPTQFEYLIVPELGFGWAGRMRGSPKFKEFIHKRLSSKARPRPGEKVYVSRSAFGLGGGRILGEKTLETQLEKQGYRIFHPENHSLEEQVEVYGSAEHLLGPVGSAMHFAAFCVAPKTKIGLIMRREAGNHSDYDDQIRSFVEEEPTWFNALAAEWGKHPRFAPDFAGKGALNFEALFAQLKEKAFVDQDAEIDLPGTRQLAQAFDRELEASGEPLFRHVRNEEWFAELNKHHDLLPRYLPIDKSLGGGTVGAEYRGVQFVKSHIVRGNAAKSISEGKYEGPELRSSLHLIKPTDRVLELGAGIGVVSCTVAKLCRPDKMVSIEANPSLVPTVERHLKLNGIENAIVRHGVVLNETTESGVVSFGVHGHYLGSSLTRANATRVEVPVITFSEIAADLNPTALIVDIVGGEVDLFESADLSGVGKIIVELHPGEYGATGVKRVFDALTKAGFIYYAGTSTGQVVTFLREYP